MILEYSEKGIVFFPDPYLVGTPADFIKRLSSQLRDIVCREAFKPGGNSIHPCLRGLLFRRRGRSFLSFERDQVVFHFPTYLLTPHEVRQMRQRGHRP